MNTFDLVLQATVSGIVVGSVYSMIALSLVIIYKSTDVVNFAGGEMLMAGGYLALLAILVLQLPYALVFGFVAFVTLSGGMLFERCVLKFIARNGSPGHNGMVSLVIATVGLSYVIKGFVRIFPYTEQVHRLPPLVTGPPIFIGNTIIQRQDIVIVGIGFLAILALGLFFQYTLTGKALRAASENPRAAELSGIPIEGMRTLVWGIAAAITGVAGVLLAPKLLLTPDIGHIVVLALAAAIIGGFTSLTGCIVGGILLGLIENFVGILISTQAIEPAPFILIMVVLTFRPQGLFGGDVSAKKV